MQNETSCYVIRSPRLDPEAKKWALIVYILQAVAPIFGGITFVIAIVLNYIKRDDVVFARVYDIRGRSISSLLAIPAFLSALALLVKYKMSLRQPAPPQADAENLQKA